MLKNKQFSRLHVSGLSLLMGLLLIVAFGFSTAQAQVTVSKYDSTYIALNHTMTSYAANAGDTTKAKINTLQLIESGAGALVSTGGTGADSLQIKPPTGWQFVKDSVVTITASQTRATGVKFDTTGFFTKYGITQTSNTLIKVKPAFIATGNINYVSVRIGGSSTAADTINVTGLYVMSTTTTAKYDSTSVSRVVVDTAGGSTINASYLVALPGPAKAITFVGTPPAASQTAGNFINSTSGGTASVDTSKGILLSFRDKANNVTGSGLTAPTVSVVLSGLTTPGNGTLSGAGTTHWVVGNHVIPVGISFDGLSYTKSESIDLKFAFGDSVCNTHFQNGGMAFAAGNPANISVSLNVNNHDTITVDGTTKYTLTVTDKFYNPVTDSTVVGASEYSGHGGIFTFPITAKTGGGQVSVTFAPSKFFVGLDSLKFTAPASSPTATQPHVITINPGSIGGLVVDYSDSVNNASLSEAIAAGKTVYARGFLRDAYGNPINATSASQITFSTNTVRKGVALGSTPVLTNTLTEAGYPNVSKSAVGIAIPYTVSTTVAGTPDTVSVTTGGYTVPVTIANRSNVPATLKMVQTTGADSSVVASNFVNTIAYTDTLWDAYNNLVTAPAAGIKIAPVRSAYGIVFASKGNVKFIRAADTVAVDTLYPATGVVTRTASSSKVSGLDTLRTWSLASSSVAASSNVWVTPAAFAAISLTPAKDTLAVAGQTRTFVAEKQDTYGNHIDWGLAGGDVRGNAPNTTKPLATGVQSILSDSTNITVDTVSTGKNRGGSVSKAHASVVGKAGVASVGGTLNFSFPFTAYTAGADTQKIYVSLGGNKDTSIVYSIPTGLLRSFKAVIAAADSVHNAGDSVAVTFTAQDSSGYRIYTYGASGQKFTLNHTIFNPVTSSDTTWYFSYVNTNGKYVKKGSIFIADTVFNQGVATIYLHKFLVDSANTVSINGSGIVATTSQSVKFVPLDVTAPAANGHWLVTFATDSLNATGNMNFTVTPRDKYYNINKTQQVIINVASNQTSGFNIGSNPKQITGVSQFNGTLSGAVGSLIVSVFSYDNQFVYGTSKAIKIIPVTGVDGDKELPKSYTLKQNYPNPFNPTTSINYELPKSGLVTLKVYDILGNEVATLVNANQNAGRYTVQFNASSLASGVYFYRIQSNNFTAVKKLMLLK